MLVLSRKIGEELHIDGDIRIRVLKISGGRVRIGIEAPPNRSIVRGELKQRGAAKPICFRGGPQGHTTDCQRSVVA